MTADPAAAEIADPAVDTIIRDPAATITRDPAARVATRVAHPDRADTRAATTRTVLAEHPSTAHREHQHPLLYPTQILREKEVMRNASPEES
jgi:hypothetical protein